MSDLQAMVDATASGGVLVLEPREYAGPVTIEHPITIEGSSATLWVRTGTALTVRAPAVHLRHLRLEVTGAPSAAKRSSSAALVVEDGRGLELVEVAVRGSVRGIEGEDGSWTIPRSVELGRIEARKRHAFALTIDVAAPCDVVSDVDGVEVTPSEVEAGRHQIRFVIDPTPPDTVLFGYIRVRTRHVTRLIAFTADTHGDGEGPQVREASAVGAKEAGAAGRRGATRTRTAKRAPDPATLGPNLETAKASRRRSRSPVPFVFVGSEHDTAASIAAALGSDQQEAIRVLVTGTLPDWIAESLHAHKAAAELRQLVVDLKDRPEHLLLGAMQLLDPVRVPVFRGVRLDRAGLGTLARAAARQNDRRSLAVVETLYLEDPLATVTRFTPSSDLAEVRTVWRDLMHELAQLAIDYVGRHGHSDVTPFVNAATMSELLLVTLDPEVWAAHTSTLTPARAANRDDAVGAATPSPAHAVFGAVARLGQARSTVESPVSVERPQGSWPRGMHRGTRRTALLVLLAGTAMALASLLMNRHGEPRVESPDAVPPGSTNQALVEALAGTGALTLPPGTYDFTDTIVVARPVRISGAGAGVTILRFTGDGDAVSVERAGHLDMSDVALIRVSGTPGDVISATAGRIDVVSAVLSGAKVGGDHRGAALHLASDSRAVVTHATLEGNAVGIELRGDARALVTNAELRENTRHGVYVAGRAEATLRSTNVVANAAEGVVVTDDGRVRISASTVASNGARGISFLHRSGGTVVESDIVANGFGAIGGDYWQGVGVQDASAPVLLHNVVRDNAGVGIQYLHDAAGIARGNLVSRNATNFESYVAASGLSAASVGGIALGRYGSAYQPLPVVFDNRVEANYGGAIVDYRAMRDPGSPSFDCARATSWAEVAICGDRALSDWDVVLDAAYGQLQRRLSGDALAAIRTDQLRWLGERDVCSTSGQAHACLERLLRERVRALSELIEAIDP